MVGASTESYTLEGSQGLWGARELAVFSWEHGNMSKFFKELGIKVDSVEQFDISFKGAFKKIFGNKGNFRNFSR